MSKPFLFDVEPLLDRALREITLLEGFMRDINVGRKGNRRTMRLRANPANKPHKAQSF